MRPAAMSALSVLLGTIAVPASSQDVQMSMFVTGNDLFERCTEPSTRSTHVANYAFCRGYIYAAADFFGTIAAENGRPSCRRSGVTGQQIVDMVVKRLRDRPEDRHLPAHYAVISVLPTLMTACSKRPG